MATKFRLRRSATADKRPIESDLLLGELALNTYDGRLYTKRDTNNVGIADTAALLTPWTENFGGGSIHYSGNKKVGIGSEIPAKTLDVWNTSGPADLRLKSTSNSFNSLTFDSNRAADSQFAIIDGRWNGNDIARIQFVTGSDGTNKDDGYMAFHTRASGASLAEALRIDSVGRVLIGTDTEGDTAADDLTISTSGATGITIRSGSTSTGNIYFSDATSGSGEYDGYIQYSQNDRHLVFGTASTERLRIASNGRVGIGSEIPDYMLDVSGAINSETDVKVGGVSVSETALNDAVAMAIALG